MLTQHVNQMATTTSRTKSDFQAKGKEYEGPYMKYFTLTLIYLMYFNKVN